MLEAELDRSDGDPDLKKIVVLYKSVKHEFEESMSTLEYSKKELRRVRKNAEASSTLWRPRIHENDHDDTRTDLE